MTEKSFFYMQLDSTIRETEKLLVMEILPKGEKLFEYPADAMRAQEMRAGNT